MADDAPIAADAPEAVHNAELNIYQRIHAVRDEVSGHIEKDGEHATQYKTADGKKKAGKPFAYISHDAVTAHIRRSTIKHRIDISPSVESYVQNGNRTEILVKVSFINIDRPTDVSANMVLAYGNDFSDKGPGKAMSYAVKVITLKRFQLNSADDIEADDIEHETEGAALKLADEREKRKTVDSTAANNLQVALKNADSIEQIEDLMKDNKKFLGGVPPVTRDHFITLAKELRHQMETE